MAFENADFYDRTALWWGKSAPTERDRERALRIHGLGRSLRVLELGAGFGGAAASTADLGHDVVAIERSPMRAALARRHLVQLRAGRLDVIEADFLDLVLETTFDVVAYWSGFGSGEGPTHSSILRRIRDWLGSGGRALVDVFDPIWWKAASGSERVIAGIHRRLGFDAETQRLSVTCWTERRRDATCVESVRCYGADEIVALADLVGLAVVHGDKCGPSHATPSYLVELTRR
jgi:SAM-dependent methyltransferase